MCCKNPIVWFVPLYWQRYRNIILLRPRHQSYRAMCGILWQSVQCYSNDITIPSSLIVGGFIGSDNGLSPIRHQTVAGPALSSLAAPVVWHNDNFRCRHWRRDWHRGSSGFSVFVHLFERLFLFTPNSCRVSSYIVLNIFHGICYPRNSEETPHGSPIRAGYGVSFVSS